MVSCQDSGYEDLKLENNELSSVSGDWWVIALEPDGVTPAFGGDYVPFTTSNVSDDGSSLWLDDHGNFMEIKTQVTINTTDLTFSGAPNSPELISEGTVTVTNGKITRNSFETTTGNLVDEISFEAEFDWAPGVVYKFTGHRKTGFLEDNDPHYSN